MRTDDLIRGLSADAAPASRSLAAVMVPVIAPGMVLSVLLLAATYMPRPDLAQALLSARYEFKLGVLALLALCAALTLARLARPGARASTVLLALAPALLIVAVALELWALPAAAWRGALIGSHVAVCLTVVPALSVPVAVAAFVALRRAAPTDARKAGAAAGLFAASFAAAIYATECPNDSPLYLAVWYVIAISAVTAAGAWAGPRLLRW